MVNFYRIVLFTLSLYSPLCFSAVWTGDGPAPPGYIDLAGFIKDERGVYSRAFTPDLPTRSTPDNNTVRTTSHPVIQTSKGAQTFDVTRSATVDVARVGKAFAKFAIASGPVGMALNIAQLACDLSSICNQAGQWMMNAPYDPTLYPDQTASIESFCTSGICSGANDTRAGSASQSCKTAAEVKQFWGSGKKGIAISATSCEVRDSSTNSVVLTSPITKVAGCPPLYVPSGSVCQFTGNNDSAPATQADWDSKESQLNDARFVPELVSKGADVPVNVPTIVGTPSKVLSDETTPTKDPQGNVTGSRRTTTTGELSDGASADHPSGGSYQEKTTVINYDINNTVINSTTTTTTQQQPEKQSFEIKFDEVPPATAQTYEVPNTFASTSWGTGQCPPDVQVNTKNVDFAIPTQPICDTATMVNPFMLMLSTLIGIYIIAGVRGGANPS